MTKITAAEVNKLRKTTGAGMMDCKKALVEANGDFELAIEILRKQGQKVAAKRALNSSTKEELMNADFGGITVQEKLIEQTGVIGEKIELSAFEKISAPYVGSYIHSGKIATIVGLSANVEGAEEVAKDIAMQAAAMNPIALNEDGVDPATIAVAPASAAVPLRKRRREKGGIDMQILLIF